jgi:hypothetical protein
VERVSIPHNLGKREQGSVIPSMVGTHAGGEAPCEGMKDALRELEKLEGIETCVLKA